MIFPPGAQAAEARLSEIALGDERYRLSRHPSDSRLLDSIRRAGVVCPPVLCRTNGGLVPVFGHNRLAALSQLGRDAVAALVVDAVDPAWYVPAALERNYRQELGPVARLRLVSLMRHAFRIDEDRVSGIARGELGVPDWLIGDAEISRITSLPPALICYLEQRSVGYKTVRELVRLDAAAIARVAGWIGMADIRVNIFKDIVRMLADLDLPREQLRALDADVDPSMDRRAGERAIHEAVFRARYPEYAASRGRVDDALREVAVPGVDVVFPDFFEGNAIELRVRLGRRDTSATLGERIGRIDADALERLLRLL